MEPSPKQTKDDAHRGVVKPESDSQSAGGYTDPRIRRELRLAITMNGGVSLAVYIGGTAHEFNRMSQGASGYGKLLSLFGYASVNDGETYQALPLIDVITGTSAGGINAAALALAQANSNGDLGGLRDLWVKHGQIGDLMREPFRKGPASLLRGDDYFYPRIREAFTMLTERFERTSISEAGSAKPLARPVDLTIPVTLLTPVAMQSVDDLGTKMVQPQHAGLLRFHGGSTRRKSGSDEDHFAGPISEKESPINKTIEALALAARASAGFPGAFEPTYLPVNSAMQNSDARPNMAEYADWAETDETGGATGEVKDQSRFAVDGGVLANTPTRPALAAIRHQEVSDTLARRVLILVHPHAETVRDMTAVVDDVNRPPSLIGTLGGVFGASGSVGSRTYVEEIQQHNDLALRWRDGRIAAMTEFDASELARFLSEGGPQPAWKLFRRMRFRRGAWVSAHRIRKEFATPFPKLVDYAAGFLRSQDAIPGGLPFLPDEPPTADDFDVDDWSWGLNMAIGIASQATDVIRELRNVQGSDQLQPDPLSKAWEVAVNRGIDLDRLLQEEMERPKPKLERPGADDSAKGQTEPENVQIRAKLKENFETYARAMVPSRYGSDRRAIGAEDPPSTQLQELPTTSTETLDVQGGFQGPSAIHPPDPTPAATLPRGRQAKTFLDEIADALVGVIRELDAKETSRSGGRGAGDKSGSEVHQQGGTQNGGAKSASGPLLMSPSNPLRGLGIAASPTDDDLRNARNELLKRMLEVEIVAYLTAEHDAVDGMVPTAPIEFVQLSANISQHFVTDGFTADDKLAGMSLQRFGAFLKRSWRANDWIWGRLDAIKVLMLIVLTPEMIRGVHRSRMWTSGQIVDEITDAAFAKRDRDYLFGPDPETPNNVQEEGRQTLQELRTNALAEVERAVDSKDDAPMTALASFAAYGFQLRAASEDVNWLAETIRDDQADGGLGTETAQFLTRIDQLSAHGNGSGDGNGNGYELLRLFADSGIGKEGLAEQVPSDLIIRTAATAAATAATALSSDRSGISFARPVTLALRGMIALPYWTLAGLSARGQITRALVATLLALGVSLTAVALVADLPDPLSKILPAVGIASLLTVLVYGAMRTRSIVHSAGLLGLFIPLVALAVDQTIKASTADDDGLGTTMVPVVCIAILVLWVVVVASFSPNSRTPIGSVFAICDAIWTTIRTHRVQSAVAGLVLLAALVGGLGFPEVVARWYPARKISEGITWLAKELSMGPWNGRLASSMTVLLVGCALFGAVTAWIMARRLRPIRKAGAPRRARLADPAGLATAWAPIYGAFYIALGVVLVPMFEIRQEKWAVAAALTSIAVGLLFSIVAVLLIPYLRERRLVRRLADYFDPASQLPTQDTEVITAFALIGDRPSYVLANKDSTKLHWRHGRRLRRRTDRILKTRHRMRVRKVEVPKPFA